MKELKIGVSIAIICFAQVLFSQTDKLYKLRISPVYGSTVLTLSEQPNILRAEDSLQITGLRFYLSYIELANKGKLVYQESNSFHLVDASVESSLLVSFSVPSKVTFDELRFDLGIDSLMNVSGAMGGDLDPTKGMYWTWQNGYINFKLEGKSTSCKSRNHEFQFHLGGYQNPFATLQRLHFAISNFEDMTLKVDVKKLLDEIDLSRQDHVMSPGKSAVMLSKKAGQIFTIEKR